MKRLLLLITTIAILSNVRGQYSASTCGTSMLISTGTYAIDGDDGFSNAITIPFSFNFYGTLYTDVYVSTNGFISFDPLHDGCCQGYILPNSNGQPYISLAQTDLYSYSATPATDGSIYYSTLGTAPNRVFVVHYQGLDECCGITPNVTGEIQLYETTNEIRIISGSINLPGRQVTMGIAKGDDLEATVISGRNSVALTAGAECWSLTNPLTLPLTLLNFSGIDNGNAGNIINWTTAGEINTKLFEVQRGSDGVNFVKLNSVAASVNSSTNKEYIYNDLFAFTDKPVFYYRLKMIDQDGHYKYSPIIMLKKDNAGGIRVFPNPFTDKMVINIQSAGKDNAIISLADINGRTIFKQNNSIRNGINAIQFNLPVQVQKGIYLLEVSTSNKAETLKVLKL